jgi:Glycosyltransferases involved in cell wall biogenesis|nr:glycosyltransferase family 2 protein [Methanothrix sp.]
MMLSIILPAYNEEENIEVIYERIKNVLTGSEYKYEIIFVDDGSTDNTEKNILNLIQTDKAVKLISFSRNFGHQSALIAGYSNCNGDAAITLDCDLEHPPELIKDLIKKWESGYDIVNAIRIDANKNASFKKYSSRYFYRLFSVFTDVKLEEGSADFRLIDKKIIDNIKNLGERELFLRGIFGWLGFKTTNVQYLPNKRFSGTTKYSMRKMVSFALTGITSFSVVPLRMAALTGFLVAALTSIYMAYALASALLIGNVLDGWTSLILAVLFLGGVQLIAIGVLGEYIGKIFIEIKGRPRYVIKSIKGW